MTKGNQNTHNIEKNWNKQKDRDKRCGRTTCSGLLNFLRFLLSFCCRSCLYSHIHKQAPSVNHVSSYLFITFIYFLSIPVNFSGLCVDFPWFLEQNNIKCYFVTVHSIESSTLLPTKYKIDCLLFFQIVSKRQ